MPQTLIKKKKEEINAKSVTGDYLIQVNIKCLLF